MGEKNIQEKLADLKAYLKDLGSVAVAFSSGVDSTFLLSVAKEVLGDQLIAVTARSCSFPKRELEEASAYCSENGIRHFIVDSEELDIDGFSQNPRNRCYLCKHELFEKIIALAEAHGISHVVEGSNMDDNSDYRPGHQAIEELHVKSPLREAALYKEEIRALSRARGLSTADKQSFACLSSRFVYGETITREKLGMVDEVEQLMLDMGFSQLRVRVHGNGTIARIEILPAEFDKLMTPHIRQTIVHKCKDVGFAYVSLDLEGYRTGSMNEA